MLGDMHCRTGCTPSHPDTVRDYTLLVRQSSHQCCTATLGDGAVDGTLGVVITTVGP